jgi:nucleoside-diphosphate-sugar epimerase
LARALIVGCGCRGRSLGRRLAASGWLVRGTARDSASAEEIRAAGLAAAIADPDRPGSVLDQAGDVALVFWLLGSARGDPELVESVNGPRLEALLERLVDTPVRGFVHEAAGSAESSYLERGRRAVADAGERWRIPVASVDSEPGEPEAWVEAMLAAAESLVGRVG